MQLLLLHLDDALTSQPDFLVACQKAGAQQINAHSEGAGIRLWGKRHALDSLYETLSQQLAYDAYEPRLSFMGSGDFHHVTSLLLKVALANAKEPVTVIHFDNHPDWVNFEGGTHCGSWVNKAVEHPGINKVITVGVCSHDLRRPEWKGANLTLLSQGLLELYPYAHAPSKVSGNYGAGASYAQQNGALQWKTIESMGEQNFIQYLLTRIKTRAVYLTIDKDVLSREDAITNWDQGHMRLPYLLSLIEEIGQNHTIIGADVTGDYSRPHYTGSLWTRLQKQAEIIIDQPRGAPHGESLININSAANHALLEVLSEAMA